MASVENDVEYYIHMTFSARRCHISILDRVIFVAIITKYLKRLQEIDSLRDE